MTAGRYKGYGIERLWPVTSHSRPVRRRQQPARESAPLISMRDAAFQQHRFAERERRTLRHLATIRVVCLDSHNLVLVIHDVLPFFLQVCRGSRSSSIRRNLAYAPGASRIARQRYQFCRAGRPSCYLHMSYLIGRSLAASDVSDLVVDTTVDLLDKLISLASNPLMRPVRKRAYA